MDGERCNGCAADCYPESFEVNKEENWVLCWQKPYLKIN